MLEFQEKRKVKRLMYSRVTLIILLLVLLFLLNGVWGVYKKQALTRENLSKTAIDLQNLKERELKLSSEIDWLKTDSGTEKEIREKYGLVKPGEEVIVIVDKNGDLEGNLDKEKLSFWQKIMSMLK